MSRLRAVTASLTLVAVAGVGFAVAGAGAHSHADRGRHDRSRAPTAQYPRQSRVALSAYLTGEAEINDAGNDSAGDPDAKGSATLLAADENTLCYAVTLRGAQPPTALHIHRAPAGQNGDVVIELSKGVPSNAAGKPSGDPGASGRCKTLEGTELQALQRILSAPQNYYINVHTAAFNKGAARGQLSRLSYDNG
ncbi:MAG: hypothetical protein V7607_2498 [Solirubrobacteraceae bacterium]